MDNKGDDLTVIRSVIQGRQSDYAILVTRYQQYVFTLAMRYVQQRELAEELAQDVFVKAYANLAGFKGESKFSTWLYTIAHTTCISHLRKRNNAPVLLEEEKMVALYDAQQHNVPVHNSRNTALAEAIGRLPETDGQVLTLFYQAAQSVDEISKIMGVTTANVKVRLFRARQKLKEIIETKYKHELID